MLTYIGGYDHGNGYTSLSLLDGDEHHTINIPSATGYGSLHEVATKRSGIGGSNAYTRDTDALGDEELVLEFGDSTYFVGSFAYEQGRDATTNFGDPMRYSSTRALLLLLTTSAKMINLPTYRLRIVTGLPVETYSPSNKQAVREALSGVFSFKLKGRSYEAHIEVVTVIMEGAGALITHGDTSSPLQGTIDVGFRTIDMVAAEGQSPRIPLCSGHTIGVAKIGELLSMRMEEHMGRVLQPLEIQKCLDAYTGRSLAYPRLNARGARVSLEQLRMWTEQSVRTVGQDVRDIVARAWRYSEKGSIAEDIAPVPVVGGGAYFFTEFIKERIPHAFMPTEPELANAQGYAELAGVLAG